MKIEPILISETHLPGFDEDSFRKRNEILLKLHQEAAEKENQLFEEALRTFANPPIHGEITKEEIQKRGINLCEETIGLEHRRWLEQNGRVISPVVSIKAITPDSIISK